MSKPTPASSKIARLRLMLLAVSGTFALTMGNNFGDVWHIDKKKYAILADANKAEFARVSGEVYRRLKAAR